MFHRLAFAPACVALFCTVSLAKPAEYGNAEEAKSMLDRAVAAVKEDKTKALEMFNKGEVALRTATSTCSVLMRRTVSSQPIRCIRMNSLRTSKAKRAFPSAKK